MVPSVPFASVLLASKISECQFLTSNVSWDLKITSRSALAFLQIYGLNHQAMCAVFAPAVPVAANLFHTPLSSLLSPLPPSSAGHTGEMRWKVAGQWICVYNSHHRNQVNVGEFWQMYSKCPCSPSYCTIISLRKGILVCALVWAHVLFIELQEMCSAVQYWNMQSWVCTCWQNTSHEKINGGCDLAMQLGTLMGTMEKFGIIWRR